MCKLSRKPILNNINWTIKEFWHLLGPNGSGKVPYSLIIGDNTKGYGQIFISLV
jgi:ABC-type molybdenum transport system ATPase subunit/photorepair protein PhrA